MKLFNPIGWRQNIDFKAEFKKHFMNIKLLYSDFLQILMKIITKSSSKYENLFVFLACIFSSRN